MTDENQPEVLEEDVVEQSEETAILTELETLQARCDVMGITYHHKHGVDKLKEKINAALATQNAEDAEEVIEQKKAVTQGRPKKAPEIVELTPEQKKRQKLSRRKRGANKLVRVRVACMNPTKKDWEGEIISVGSSRLGTYKKYVPFNNDEGWHIPQIILWAMQERMCSSFKSVRNARGNITRKAFQVKEFNIEIMDPLTPDELQTLADDQRARNSAPQDGR